jgi:tetratricopeptide (TPR) repeat protein
MKNVRYPSVLLYVVPWLLLLIANHASAQAPNLHDLFKAERWPELAELIQSETNRSAELEFEYGVSLAHLEKWDEARAALLRGQKLSPGDTRFPEELAGIAFKLRNNSLARHYLRRTLRIDAHDQYAHDFLATIYFLDGNLEASIAHWNRIDKPQIAGLRNEPALRVRPALLDHAIAFSPSSTVSLDDFRASRQRLDHLEIFPVHRFDFVAQKQGSFEAVLRAQELDGFGTGKVQALVRALRGIAFQEVTPEYDNLQGSALNILTLARWDQNKRRYQATVSGPLWQMPQWRYWISAGMRNENWDLRDRFTGPSPSLAAFNLRREEVAGEIERLVGWRWHWKVGLELSHRDERNVNSGGALAPQLLESGYQLKQTASLRHETWRSADHRASLETGVASEAGKLWSTPHSSFAKLQAGITAHWLPQARGDDYEILFRTRAAKTFGDIPFDELWMLGLERDNDLWLRGHIGTRDGRKGSAPLGKDYFLANSELDKNIYSNGILGFKLGPFVDAGKFFDVAAGLGSREWLVDAGAQLKMRVLGVGVVFSFGKDLRTGNNAFYTAVMR